MSIELVVFDIAGMTLVKERAEETFRALRSAGIRIGLDAECNRTIVDTVIDRLNWRSLVDISVAADEVDRRRPYPDLIGRAMLLARVASARDVAKVAATTADLTAAWAAGCRRVIAVRSGAESADALELAAYTDFVDDVTEIVPLCLVDRSRR